MPAGAKTEDEATAAYLVDGVGYRGEQGWVTESAAGDERACATRLVTAARAARSDHASHPLKETTAGSRMIR